MFLLLAVLSVPFAWWTGGSVSACGFHMYTFGGTGVWDSWVRMRGQILRGNGVDAAELMKAYWLPGGNPADGVNPAAPPKPPAPEKMVYLYEQVATMLKKYGLSSRLSTAGCVRCGACSALSLFEEL